MEKVFECHLCKKEFNSLQKINLHFKHQHDGVNDSKKKTFKCNICGYEFKTEQFLIRHTRTHTGERPFKCAKRDCGMVFKTTSTLNDHIKYKHSDERGFKCDFPTCLYAAKTSARLSDHKKVHSNERPFACPQSGCNYRCKIKSNLSRHTSSMHFEFKTFNCSKCTFKTDNARRLVQHTRTVHDGRNENVPCPIEGCEYKGKHNKALNKHMWLHKTLLACPITGCARYLPTKEALESHLKLHNPSTRPLQCPLCFKHYMTLDMLQQHCVIHTNEKPFQCGHCKYEAARRTFVTRHISSIHSAIEFPFVVHLLNDRECLGCKVILPSREFVVHRKNHVGSTVMK